MAGILTFSDIYGGSKGDKTFTGGKTRVEDEAKIERVIPTPSGDNGDDKVTYSFLALLGLLVVIRVLQEYQKKGV